MYAIMSGKVNGVITEIDGLPVASIDEAAKIFGDIYLEGGEEGLRHELSCLGVARSGEELNDGSRTEIVIELFNDDWTNAVDTSATLLSPESRAKLID